MSYHIITVLKPGARLSADRGFLVCKYPDGEENRIALADVRTLIIGVPGVGFTGTCIARLLAQDSLILHCDSHYKPIGWSASLDRVIRREVFANQIQQDKNYNNTLWKMISRQKMLNQAAMLDWLDIPHNLYYLIEKPLANEANVARQYWRNYFAALGNNQIREKKGAKSFENKALNYGYAVISTLVHRAILIYGLLPSLGIHHDFRYRSNPLVYDIMEPFRGFVDLFLAKWIQNFCEDLPEEEDFEDWIYHYMQSLQQCRIKVPEEKHSQKLIDAIDKCVASVATCYENRYFKSEITDRLWLPQLKYHYWLKNTAEEDKNNDTDYRITHEECF